MSLVRRRECIPNGSIISDGFGEFDYCDSYETAIEVQNRSIDQILNDLLDLSSHLWVVGLKRIRDVLAKRFGLQTDENMLTNKTSNYRPSSKALLFTVLKRTVNEIVMGKNDKHLDFRFSVLLDHNDSKVYVTTIIKYHNLGGRGYFRLIKPLHQLIIYSLVKKNLARQGDARAMS